VFSITFSLWDVCEAIAAFDLPSHTNPKTSCSKGVSSLVEIVMSLAMCHAASPRVPIVYFFFSQVTP
jgi:hypothetical protein